MTRNGLWQAALGAVLLTLAGCSDRMLMGPETGSNLPPGAVLLQCVADVAIEEIRCDPAPRPATPGLRPDVHVGSQDRYVKLTSSNTAFDGGTRIFSSIITVQNLTRQAMGTDGVNTPGLRVFFHTGPSMVAGSGGSVTVQNPDGTDMFTDDNQPFYLYPSVLQPMEISAGKQWMFLLDPGVSTFAFSVYVATPMADETAPLLGPTWSASATSSSWTDPANWDGGALPGPDSSVTVPTDSMLGSAPDPALAADAAVRHLRVGFGSTLNLEGFTIDVGGNVDATGAISGGTVRVTGSSVVVGGTLPTVNVTGSARVQRATRATGPVSISGSLTVRDIPLTISLP